MYSVIGDFQASFYFGVDSNTGVITVRNDLLNDIVEDYTVRALKPGTSGVVLCVTCASVQEHLVWCFV